MDDEVEVKHLLSAMQQLIAISRNHDKAMRHMVEVCKELLDRVEAIEQQLSPKAHA